MNIFKKRKSNVDVISEEDREKLFKASSRKKSISQEIKNSMKEIFNVNDMSYKKSKEKTNSKKEENIFKLSEENIVESFEEEVEEEDLEPQDDDEVEEKEDVGLSKSFKFPSNRKSVSLENNKFLDEVEKITSYQFPYQTNQFDKLKNWKFPTKKL